MPLWCAWAWPRSPQPSAPVACKIIFRGLSMMDYRLIMAGAVPAAVLAIAADALLGGLEKYLVRWR